MGISTGERIAALMETEDGAPTYRAYGGVTGGINVGRERRRGYCPRDHLKLVPRIRHP